MMKHWMAGIAALLLAGIGGPAPAQSGERDVARAMRTFGNVTSGQRVGGGAAADKVLWFARGAGGQLAVMQIEALALGGPWGEVPARAVAVMRTRASSAGSNAAPDAADLALATSSGIPVFIVGEWRTPPTIWELRRRGDRVELREIDEGGQPGPWRAAAQ